MLHSYSLFNGIGPVKSAPITIFARFRVAAGRDIGWTLLDYRVRLSNSLYLLIFVENQLLPDTDAEVNFG